MHRIDGPGATVDNRFTDGDPVGGVQATMVTDDWANDVQEELISILAAASITPVKGTQNQVLSAIRKLSTGVVGGARNGRMSVASASASGTLTADEVIVKSALGGQAWLLSGFSKTINLASTGAGGMDTGSAPVNGYVALYAIFNPTSGVSALLAANATAAAAPEVYGGANMPSGYTASALLTVSPTNGSGQFKIHFVSGNTVAFPQFQAATVNSVVTNSPVSLAAVIPPNARKIRGQLLVGNTGSAFVSAAIAADAQQTGYQTNGSAVSAGSPTTSNYSGSPVITPQQIYLTTTSTAGTPTYTIVVAGYDI